MFACCATTRATPTALEHRQPTCSAFANALQRGGYATDPEYANKLVASFAQIAGRQPLPRRRLNVKAFKSADASPIPPQELSNG